MPSVRILLCDLGSERSELNEPIGIGTLTSHLQAELGDSCRVEQSLYPLDDLPDEVALGQADIVGLSTRLGSLSRFRTIRDRILRVPPERRPLLILGDLIATFATQQILEEAPEAICVIGEGEEAIVGIAGAWLDSAGAPDELRQMLLQREVPNLVFMLGATQHATPRRLIDLAAMPAPDRSFVSRVAQLGGIIRAEASRGCAWGLCNFCAIQFKYCDSISWRTIPNERIVGELETLAALGVRSPFYTDEDFIGSDPQRTISLARAIRDARDKERIAPELTLYVDMRVDTILAPARKGLPSGEDVLRELKTAGLREVFIGIESGAKEQVRRYRKAATAQRNLAAIELLKRHGISLDVGFIMFDPEMQFPELRANLEFIQESGLYYHDARLTKSLRVEAGTPLVEDYRRKDLLIGPLDPDELTYPYRWLDSRVAAVHSAFTAWEAPRMDEIYDIQAKTRGEMPSEAIRQQRRAYLGKLRGLDLDVLGELIRRTENSEDPVAVDLSAFQKQRDTLLADRHALA